MAWRRDTIYTEIGNLRLSGGNVLRPYPFGAVVLEKGQTHGHSGRLVLARAGGEPSSAAHTKEAAQVVRAALRRGERLALKRGTSEKRVGDIPIFIEGVFQEREPVRLETKHPRGWDGETKYVVEWVGGWNFERGRRQVIATLSLTFNPKTISTTYYGGATAAARHRDQGTLGAHERAHADLARTWWTVGRLRAIAADERMAFALTLPPGLSLRDIKERCVRQFDAVGNFMRARHQCEQETKLDHLSGTSAPTFVGARW